MHVIRNYESCAYMRINSSVNKKYRYCQGIHVIYTRRENIHEYMPTIIRIYIYIYILLVWHVMGE